MNRAVLTVNSRLAALTAGAALIAGSIAVGAPSAVAAPGDVTSFPTGVAAFGIAQDASGVLWVTNQGASSVSKVALDGSTVTFQTAALPVPGPIAAGVDSSMWVTTAGNDNIGKLSPEGALQAFSNGQGASATDIALGPDGNMWFTLPLVSKVGKISPTGAVTTYATGNTRYHSLTPGPKGSNRMYLASKADNAIGFVDMAGNFTRLDGPAGGNDIFDIQLVNDQIWLTPSNGVSSSLARLVGDSGFTQVSNAALVNPYAIAPGIGGTMWVATEARAIVQVSTAGEVLASYTLPVQNPLRDLLQAQDGNVWVTNSDQVTRVLTGVTPVSTQAPALDATTALVAGSTVTTNNGTWNYRPSSYTYQWQVCATNDAASCADVAGSTGKTYTIASGDVGKYVRAGVRAINLNGPSNPAYSSLVATGQAAPPVVPPAPATGGSTADIGNSVTMELDAPSSQKRNTSKFYEVTFSSDEVKGKVTFKFKKGSRAVTKTVTVQEGLAEYRWKAPRNWRTGVTVVTATFRPVAGAPYQAATVKDRVRIR
ncbi:MAG: hypothetical protein RJB01_1216 [Actinomycetota bacterium]|jgi:virginiamycin B lyase